MKIAGNGLVRWRILARLDLGLTELRGMLLMSPGKDSVKSQFALTSLDPQHDFSNLVALSVPVGVPNQSDRGTAIQCFRSFGVLASFDAFGRDDRCSQWRSQGVRKMPERGSFAPRQSGQRSQGTRRPDSVGLRRAPLGGQISLQRGGCTRFNQRTLHAPDAFPRSPKPYAIPTDGLCPESCFGKRRGKPSQGPLRPRSRIPMKRVSNEI